jgi:hypothetical protein
MDNRGFSRDYHVAISADAHSTKKDRENWDKSEVKITKLY